MSDKDYYSSPDLDLDSNLDSNLDSEINISLKIEQQSVKIEELNVKIDEILHILKKDISQNTKKMSDHINFVENVYENVKYPLGFICNTAKYYMGTTKYTLNSKIDYFKKLK